VSNSAAQGKCELQIDHCDFPEDALYDVDRRVWVRLLGEKTATVGMTSVHFALAGRLNKLLHG